MAQSTNATNKNWLSLWPFFLLVGVWIVLYSLVLISCLGLVVRLLLQSAALWNVFLGVLYGWGSLTVFSKPKSVGTPDKPASYTEERF